MHLEQFDRTDRRAVRDFIDLPFRVYKDIPQWVPTLRGDEMQRFKADFTFYEHSEAAFFLVRDEAGQAVGRAAALHHRPYTEYHKSKDAQIYLYEAIDDNEVAGLLFEAATEWAQARGLTRLMGPKGFLLNDGHGLLIEGFEHRPALGIPYNPAYYVRQFEEIGGMTKEVDFVSGFVSGEDWEFPPKMRRLADKIAERRGFQVPMFKNKREIRAYIPSLTEAYNRSFSELWSYRPVTEAELDTILSNMLLIARPSMIKVVLNKDDEVIGFQFAYPDVSAAFQRQKGRLFPFGWIDVLLERNRTKWLNVSGNAILPEYRLLGGNALLYAQMAETVAGPGTQFRYGDLVQVQESNADMLGDLMNIIPNAHIYKKHRVYQRTLTESDD